MLTSYSHRALVFDPVFRVVHLIVNVVDVSLYLCD